ncbi:hypothetical protein [uncultured Draconibacterium sp.]
MKKVKFICKKGSEKFGRNKTLFTFAAALREAQFIDNMGTGTAKVSAVDY